MRIAVYAEVFVRPTETFIYETTTGLVASGHDVVVVADTRASAEDRPFEPVTLVSPPGRWAPNHLLRRVLRPLRGMPEGGEQAAIHRERLFRVLADARPDVILANRSGPQKLDTALGGVFCRVVKRPAVSGPSQSEPHPGCVVQANCADDAGYRTGSTGRAQLAIPPASRRLEDRRLRI